MSVCIMECTIAVSSLHHTIFTVFCILNATCNCHQKNVGQVCFSNYLHYMRFWSSGNVDGSPIPPFQSNKLQHCMLPQTDLLGHFIVVYFSNYDPGGAHACVRCSHMTHMFTYMTLTANIMFLPTCEIIKH